MSGKFHPLTLRIWSHQPFTPTSIDKSVREYMDEKVKEVNDILDEKDRRG